MEINDINEFEQQRYNNIKKSDKYVEVNIIVGAEKEHFYGHTGVVPAVRTILHNCGPEEIGALYVTLQSLMDKLEEEYPLACLYGRTAMKATMLKQTETSLNDSTEEE